MTLTCDVQKFPEQHKTILALYIIPQYWNDTDSWKDQEMLIIYIQNTMGADDLVMLKN